MNTNPPAIALYGLGQYGQLVARFALDKGWPIVAAYNRPGGKVGRDLGEVIGHDDLTGIIVQDTETADYESAKADIAVVAVTDSLAINMHAYRRLLSAGMNVICHAVEAYFPYGNDAELAREIDTLARDNGVTFCGSGIWDMSRIWTGIMVAGPCTEITSLFHRSITEATTGGREILLKTGVGQTPLQFKEKTRGFNAANAYQTINEHVLTALGYTIKSSDSYLKPIIATKDTECEMLGRTIPKGDCIGTRSVTNTHTIEGVTAKSHVEVRLFEDGEQEHTLWSVEGKPATRIRVERDDSRHATASSLFNRIPDVLSANPGLTTVSQLGPLTHTAIPGDSSRP